MTNLSKVLAVLATVASLAFLGVVAVSAVGGPNYEAEIEDPTLSAVTFTREYDEATGVETWTAQSRLKQPEDPTKSASEYKHKVIQSDAKVLPGVLVKAHEFVKQQQKQRLNGITKIDDNGNEVVVVKGLNQKIDDRKEQIKQAVRLFAIDETAMQKRIAAVDQQLNDLRAQLVKRKDEIISIRRDELEERKRAESLRDDIRRLTNQIDELAADRFRLIEQRKRLVVLIEMMKGTLARLERRNALLKQKAE